MIYFIVTTCLFTDPTRESQYKQGIQTLLTHIEVLSDYKVIIVENNGKRPTFLDQFVSDKCKILYTHNNSIDTLYKGYKEIMDILDCITLEKIQPEDFIVKITGRYILQENSEFINRLKEVEKYDCILRYGSFNESSREKCHDCITGLIGMRCKYIQRIEKPSFTTPIEWNWARVTYLIPSDRICELKQLGISIFPANIECYRLV